MTDPGLKYDAAKTRHELLPLRALASVAQVLTHGAVKYGDENWRRLERFDDRYFAAAMRHLTRVKLGERIDPDTELPHLAHAACSILFMLSKEVGFDEGFGALPAEGSGEKLFDRMPKGIGPAATPLDPFGPPVKGKKKSGKK